MQGQEHRLMRHAQKAVMHNMARFHEEHEAETEEKCAWRTNDLKLTHENQVYNLNLEVGPMRGRERHVPSASSLFLPSSRRSVRAPRRLDTSAGHT